MGDNKNTTNGKPVHKHWSLMTLTVIALVGLFVIGAFAFMVDQQSEEDQIDDTALQQDTDTTEATNDQIAIRDKLISDNSPDSYLDLIQQGYNYMYLGDYETAVDYFKQADSAKPNDPDILQNIGFAYRLSEDADNTVKYLNLAITQYQQQTDTEQIISRLQRTIELTEQGDFISNPEENSFAQPL